MPPARQPSPAEDPSTEPAAEAIAIVGSRASVIWLAAGGCDGCTMSVLGAVSPAIEDLLGGGLTDIPTIDLVHPALSLESGARYLASLEAAADGRSDAFVLVVEGALLDNDLAADGTFSGLGSRDAQPIPVEHWVARLAHHAQAVIAIGTCAASGGIPAARGSVTGAMGLRAFLGEPFRSRAGLPVVNVPGCAPNGDAFIEALSHVFLALRGLIPLDLDELGRPRWLYAEPTALQAVPRAGAPAAPAHGQHAFCPVPQRGWINRVGGCARVGGGCDGCTRSDFPDGPLSILAGG
jgi:hydrogenase small subunit